MSASGKTTRAVMWGGCELVLRQGVVLAVSVVLARLLSPEEFGVVAMLSLFTGVAGVIAEGGFGAALIQRPTLSGEETSSVFYFNLMASLVTAGLLGLAAPWIADFYRMPVLEPLTWFMALNLFLGSFRTVPVALLTRRLDFKLQMKVSLASTVVPGILGIALAWKGWGVWSLAAQSMAATCIGGTLLLVLGPWRPSWCFRPSALRSLAGYGSFMALSGLLDTVCSRLNTLVIGRWYSAHDLGLYTRADGIQQLPTSSLSALAGRIAFPVFSAAAAVDPAALRDAGRRALAGVMLLNTPAMVGIGCTASSLVEVVFGRVWLPCVPILQVLCLAGLFWPLHVVNLNLVKARGRSDLFLRLEVIKKGIGLAALVVAAPHGLLALAWSQVFVGGACYWVNGSHSGRLALYPISRQLRDASPYLAVAAVMGVAVLGAGALVTGSPGLRLAVQIALGAGVYAGLCALFDLPAYRDARNRCGALFRRPETLPTCA
jgi:O-antigen/teichoic acid export membrane protein